MGVFTRRGARAGGGGGGALPRARARERAHTHNVPQSHARMHCAALAAHTHTYTLKSYTASYNDLQNKQVLCVEDSERPGTSDSEPAIASKGSISILTCRQLVVQCQCHTAFASSM